MPVSAAVPLENACKIKNGVTATIAVSSISGGFTTIPSDPVKYRANPIPIVINMTITKK